jgi:hypothetical protein
VSQGRRQSDDPGDLSAGSDPVCLSGQDPAAPLKLRQRSGQADRDSDLSAGSCPTCPRCGWPEDDEHTELSCAVEIVVHYLGEHDQEDLAAAVAIATDQTSDEDRAEQILAARQWWAARNQEPS